MLLVCYYGVLFVCYWCLGSFTTATMRCGTLGGHLQVLQWVVGIFSPSKGPECVVAIIQHPERVVAKIFYHIPFCAFLGAFWALKTLNERIRTLRLTYTRSTLTPE